MRRPQTFAAPELGGRQTGNALSAQGLGTPAQDLVKPEFTAKTYVPEQPTEKMKNAQVRTTPVQALQASYSCTLKPR